MDELSGRVALVTGAAGGIGLAITQALLARGARLVAVDLDEVSISESSGVRLRSERCDISDPGAVKQLFATLATSNLLPDILISNAGIYPAAAFEDITFESWRKVFAVNVEAAFHLCQRSLPTMRGRGWGRVIAIGSNTQHMGWPMLSHYVASKCALTGLMRTLAIEYGGFGITANVVCPTLTRTPGTAALFDQASGLVDSVVNRQAIQRPGTPEDVAGAVTMLCRTEAAFVTGQTLCADGGLIKL